MEVNRILLGNNLELMRTFPDDLVDLTITSPPYNKGEKTDTGKIQKKIKYDSISDDLDEEEYQAQQIEVVNEIYRITKPGGHLFYNHKNRYGNKTYISPTDWLRKTKFKIRQEIIWDRKSTVNMDHCTFWNVDERIYWLFKDSNNSSSVYKLYKKRDQPTNVWRYEAERNNKHPAPFPVKLPKNIIGALYGTQKNKLIFDPYMGSGSTAIAAFELGHNYLGCEISETYRQMALDRLKSAKAPGKFVEDLIQF